MSDCRHLYNLCADILQCLWRNDDILFEEDWDVAIRKAHELAEFITDPDLDTLIEILSRAEDRCLDQESLFDAQGVAEDLTKEYAEKEHQWADFGRRFSWL